MLIHVYVVYLKINLLYLPESILKKEAQITFEYTTKTGGLAQPKRELLNTANAHASYRV